MGGADTAMVHRTPTIGSVERNNIISSSENNFEGFRTEKSACGNFLNSPVTKPFWARR